MYVNYKYDKLYVSRIYKALLKLTQYGEEKKNQAHLKNEQSIWKDISLHKIYGR